MLDRHPAARRTRPASATRTGRDVDPAAARDHTIVSADDRAGRRWVIEGQTPIDPFDSPYLYCEPLRWVRVCSNLKRRMRRAPVG